MVNKELVRNEHSVGQNCFHLTWTPKYRYPLGRTSGMRRVLWRGISDSAKRWGIKVIELRVMEDHVHVFVHIPPTMSVSKCVQILKGASSHQIRELMPRLKGYNALWSRGYFYRSVGAVTGAVVENYIRNSQGDHAYWKQKPLANQIGLTRASE